MALLVEEQCAPCTNTRPFRKGGYQVTSHNVQPRRRSRKDADPDHGNKVTTAWPPRPETFGELLTPVEAAQYLRMDETGRHTPQSAIRTLNYWRAKGRLKATKFARRVWYRTAELDRFLAEMTED